jgi:hypothetical protein
MFLFFSLLDGPPTVVRAFDRRLAIHPFWIV